MSRLPNSAHDYISLDMAVSENAAKFPGNIAIEKGSEYASYNELETRSNAISNLIADHLDERDDKQGQPRIAIFGESSINFIATMLAILKYGGIIIPINPVLPLERIRLILDVALPDAIVTTVSHYSDLIQFVKKIKAKIPIFIVGENAIQSSEEIEEYPHFYQTILNSSQLNYERRFENICFMNFTSGSTGIPKGVLGNQRAISHVVNWQIRQFNLDDKTKVSQLTDVSFIPFLRDVFVPLTAGGTCCIVPREERVDISRLIAHLENSEISMLHMSPTLFKAIIASLNQEENKEAHFASLKYLMLGSELIRGKEVKEFFKMFGNRIQLINVYGSTETISIKYFYILHPEDTTKHIIPAGKPISGVEAIILDENLHPASEHSKGILYIKSNYLFTGYFNNTEATQKAFIHNPNNNDPNDLIFCTHDIARLLADGNLEILGRADHIVKVRGNRVELGEIENRMVHYPGIREAVVILRKDKNTEEYLCAYFLSDTEINISSLREYLAEWLTEYMIPAHFIRLEKMPRLYNGKLDRKSLPAPDIFHRSSDRAYIKPHNPLEQQLATIWEETLKVDKIGINDNFFELGGNSLIAGRIISKIRKLLQKEVSLIEFDKAATISGLANVIANIKTSDVQIKQDVQSNINPQSDIIPLADAQFLFWLVRILLPSARGLVIADRQRVKGKLDVNKLKPAFELLFKNQEILSYQIASSSPVQRLKENLQFEIEEEDLQGLSAKDQEIYLSQSMINLQNFRAWKKDQRLIKVKLYHLSNNISELQFCISHVIADEISLKIIFLSLSHFYSVNQPTVEDKYFNVTPYKDHIFEDRARLKSNLQKNIEFWKQNFSHVNLVSFLPETIIDKKSKNISYTSYFELSNEWLDKLKTFCAQNKIGIGDCIYSAIALTMAAYSENHKNTQSNQSIVIGTLVSTRNDEKYDKTIGQFLRTDLYKIDFQNTTSLIELANSIKNIKLETGVYQECSGIIKYACLLQKSWQNKRVLNFLLKAFIKIYMKICSKADLNYDVLLMTGRQLLSWPKHDFLIHVNIMNSFLMYNEIDKLFGFEIEKLDIQHIDEDKTSQNLVDIFFTKKNDFNIPYLVINAGLKPEFREVLAKDIIRRLSELH